jgi:hypothetical protein
VLVSVVAPNEAAGRGAEHTVMMGIVTCRAAHDRPLDAAFGRCGSRHAREREDRSISAPVSTTDLIGLPRVPERGWSALDCRICWGRSGDALIKTQFSPSPVTARLACVRGRTRGSPAQARRHTGQRQFHCGKPPPPAEPRTMAVRRPNSRLRQARQDLELGRQVAVDLEPNADFDERRCGPGHRRSFELCHAWTLSGLWSWRKLRQRAQSQACSKGRCDWRRWQKKETGPLEPGSPSIIKALQWQTCVCGATGYAGDRVSQRCNVQTDARVCRRISPRLSRCGLHRGPKFVGRVGLPRFRGRNQTTKAISQASPSACQSNRIAPLSC